MCILRFFLSKLPHIPLYYFTKMLMILQEEAHVWQIKLDVKGAPSTSMHCGRALTETICCNTEITNVISVFDNMIVSVSFKKGITACHFLRL